MPKYPRQAQQYYAILEGVEEQAELDCGCLIVENEDNESIELWLCTLHESAQRLLDALVRVGRNAYVDKAADALMCVFCEASEDHEEDCVMHLVHDVIRQAKGGG